MYTIAGRLAENDNAKLVAHVSHTIEITGDVMDMNVSVEQTHPPVHKERIRLQPAVGDRGMAHRAVFRGDHTPSRAAHEFRTRTDESFSRSA